MANKNTTLTGLFTNIADAIREKTGGTESIVADNFPEAIAAIDTQENLDTELSTQDDLIAQIAIALEGKTGASGGESTSNVIFAGYVTATDSEYLHHESFKTCTDFVLTLSIDRVTNTSLDANNLIVSYVFEIVYDNELEEYYPVYKITYGGATCNYPTNVHTEGMVSTDEGYIYSSRSAFNTTANAYYLVAWSDNNTNTSVPITFIIHDYLGNATYQAEEGMTWGEWVNSSYNTGGYKLGSEEVNGLTGTGFEVLDSQGGCYLEYASRGEILSAVSCDQIVANVEYTCTGGDLG